MLFDTDILIWVTRGHPNAIALLETTPRLFMSQISYMEIIQGARDKRELSAIKKALALADFTILPLSETIGDRAVEYMEHHSLKDGLELADALIASTASVNDLTLATANVKHFRSLRDVSLYPFKP